MDWTTGVSRFSLKDLRAYYAEHFGDNFLCEQVNVDENRVTVEEIDVESGDVSGGYLLELDTYFDEAYHCCPEKFYHKVNCLFESSSGTLTGSSGLL